MRDKSFIFLRSPVLVQQTLCTTPYICGTHQELAD
jgi:hypothetical protein